MRTWIFQANPNRYKIGDSLRFETEELWNLNQYAQRVKAGDRVLIWICGPQAGIYAVGTILTDPSVSSDSPTGIKYWQSKEDGLKAKPRVTVRYDRVLLDRPLRREYLEFNHDLRNLAILRSPRGTNFAVTDGEWEAIQWFLESVG